MNTQNEWGVFVQRNYGLLRGMRLFFAVMLIVPLFWISVGWHGGTINALWLCIMLSIAALLTWLTHLLRKYKPE